MAIRILLGDSVWTRNKAALSIFVDNHYRSHDSMLDGILVNSVIIYYEFLRYNCVVQPAGYLPMFQEVTEAC